MCQGECLTLAGMRSNEATLVGLEVIAWTNSLLWHLAGSARFWKVELFMLTNGRDVESGRIVERGRQPRDFSIATTAGAGVGATASLRELALEKHYSVSELAQLWQLSEKTIRRMFLGEPGVVKWGHEEKRFKRAYLTVRIPESIVQRVHRRLRQAG